MSVLEISRVDRVDRTYDLAALFPDLEGPLTTADVALLTKGGSPTAATVWTAVTVTNGVATVLWAGPDADSTGAVAVAGTCDSWMRVSDGDETRAVKLGRITVLGGGAQLAAPVGVPVVSVNSKTGSAVVLTSGDVGAVAVGAGAGGALSGSYPNPGLNTTALDNAVEGLVNDTASDASVALRAAFVPQSQDGAQRLAAQKAVPLRSFHAATALRETAPVTIAMIADSIQEGDGVTDYFKRPQSLLADRLLGHWRIPGMTTQGVQFIGGWQQNGSMHPTPMVLTNATSTGYDQNVLGLARRAVVLAQTGAKWEMRDARQMTSFDVVYHQNSGGDLIDVLVDGAVVDTFTTAGTTTYSKRKHYSVAAGVHKVAVQRNGAQTTTRPVLLGVFTFETADSYTKGFHVWDGAHSGYCVDDFLTKSASNLTIANDLAAVNPDLIIISLGANDEEAVEGISPEKFYADLGTLISYRDGCAKKPGILLMPVWKRSNVDQATHMQYVAKQYQRMTEDPRNAILDLNLHFPAIADGVNPTSDTLTYRGLYYDTVHPSNAGASLLADILARYLAPPV